LKIIRHIWAKKHFVENFHQSFGEKSFQKTIVQNIHFLQKKKKKKLKKSLFFSNYKKN